MWSDEQRRLAAGHVSLCLNDPNGTNPHLRRYASTSSPSTTDKTLHLTMSSISSHTALGTLRRPLYPPDLDEPEDEEPSPLLLEDGSDSGEGANQTSSSFSGPSKGPGEVRTSDPEAESAPCSAAAGGGVRAILLSRQNHSDIGRLKAVEGSKSIEARRNWC